MEKKWELTDELQLVSPQGKSTKLSAKRYLVLKKLLDNKNEVISYDDLKNYAGIEQQKSLWQFIIDLKRDIEGLPILTITGQGYMWKEASEQ